MNFTCLFLGGYVNVCHLWFMLQFFSIHIFKYHSVYGVLWREKKRDVFTKILVPAISQEEFAMQIKHEDKWRRNVHLGHLLLCLCTCVSHHHYLCLSVCSVLVYFLEKVCTHVVWYGCLQIILLVQWGWDVITVSLFVTTAICVH